MCRPSGPAVPGDLYEARLGQEAWAEDLKQSAT